jgi:ketosteroid isomerase-like protein
MMIRRLAIATLLLSVSPGAASAVQNPAVPALAPAARPAAAVVDRFHAALRRGDTAGALAHLSDDVLIYESGGAERSKAEYASHHLGADAAFSQAVPSTLTGRSGWSAANVAWIASESRNTGTFRGRAIDSMSKETMVLRRTPAGWRIVHIHWSSANAKK